MRSAVDPKVIAEIVAELIPAVAMVMLFGMPVAIVWTVHHFRFRKRELEAELEARRMLGERDKAELSARIERLESVLLGQAGQARQQVPEPVALPPTRVPVAFPDFPERAPELAGKRERE
jgi:hypothetical protein